MKIPFTPETALICKLFQKDAFKEALALGVGEDLWEDETIRELWKAMVRVNRRGDVHELPTIWFECNSFGEDLAAVCLDLFTDRRDFTFSTMSTSWFVEKAFGKNP